MLRFLFIFGVLIAVNSFAANNKENVQILAENLNHKGDIIRASGNVLIFSPSYYITAKEVIYNKNKKTLELFNDVNILKDNKLLSITDYAFIDFINDTSLSRPILMLDKETNLWINAKESKKEKTVHYFDSSTLSSCDCDTPFWSIGFTSGDYDTKDKWVNTYNSKLYLGSVPVFYTPWFGFTTNTQRRTGLLQPTIGMDTTEGLLYAQPIFIAPEQNWDIEITPQVRTKRGAGLYAQFRYKGTENSYLNIKTGYFKEKESFQTENNIDNNSHYGLELDYYNKNIFAKSDDQDAVSVKLYGLNDVGYKSLENVSDSTYTTADNIATSQLDYFYNTNKYFGYTEFKYFKDVRTSVDQDAIVQQLPKVKLHSYSKQIANSGVLYSGDLTYINYTRDTGLEVNSLALRVPFSYNLSLFDDFVNINFKEQILANYINYHGDSSGYSDRKYMETNHIATISTDLIGSYKDYIHTLNFQSTLTIPNIVTDKGSDNTISPITKTAENINFSLNHSFYDKENLKQIINHKIDQSINYKESGDDQFSDLRNELIYYYAYGQISNKLTYSHQDSAIVASTSIINFKHDNFYINLNHTDTQNYEAINFTIGSIFNRYYSLQYRENYNLDDSISNIREYSLNIDKRCWALNIKLSDNLVASPTIDSDAIRQNIIYFLFTMKPIGQIQQQHVMDNTQGN